MTNKVFLIRHAESEANVGIPQKYVHNIVITENGRQQAKELAEILEKPDRIIVSKFIRTIETAEPVINKFPEVEVHLWPDIHEFEPGKSVKHLSHEERIIASEAYWSLLDPDHKLSEDIETFKEFIDRLLKAKHRISGLEGLNYIFTHSYVLKLFTIMRDKPNLFDSQDGLDYKKIMQEFACLNKVFKTENTGVYDFSDFTNQ